MAKFVPDIKTQRWIVLSTDRVTRDVEAKVIPEKNPQGDPFAENFEFLTPPEVFRIGEGEPDKPGWQVRVVPNKYPITDIHEVIIHSPDAESDIETLPTLQVEKILYAYKQRFNVYRDQGHVLIFANHGNMAGPSLRHPHSQVVVIPKQINLDALEREPVNNIVTENTYFNVYCPDFSQWPYEVWIAPKQENTFFGDIQDEQIGHLAQILQNTIKKLHKVFDDPTLSKFKNKNEEFAYNFYIYHNVNWFIRIIPRWIHRAGFELGTGLSVNIIDPKEAARVLLQL